MNNNNDKHNTEQLNTELLTSRDEEPQRDLDKHNTEEPQRDLEAALVNLHSSSNTFYALSDRAKVICDTAAMSIIAQQLKS